MGHSQCGWATLNARTATIPVVSARDSAEDMPFDHLYCQDWSLGSRVQSMVGSATESPPRTFTRRSSSRWEGQPAMLLSGAVAETPQLPSDDQRMPSALTSVLGARQAMRSSGGERNRDRSFFRFRRGRQRPPDTRQTLRRCDRRAGHK